MDSYMYESFSNWKHPLVSLVLFSPNNGLFPYTPIFIFILIGIFYMIVKKNRIGYILLIAFILMIYILSSWWAVEFGCSYGARNFVEYYAILCLPLAYLIKNINNKYFKICVFGIIFFLIIINLKIIYSYDECFFGKNNWDWNEYFSLITRHVIKPLIFD